MKNFIYTIWFALGLIGCSNDEQVTDDIPIHDSFELVSNEVNETRVISVWTPTDYHTTNINYPVLYMLDGGINEDFPHIANTISSLIKNGKIPPIILVGIENTERGRDMTGASEQTADSLYCPLTDGAKKFRSFIINELTVSIDEKYRTNSRRGIIGESLAGLFVMETFLLNPESFNFYVAMDPSLWWNDHSLVKHAKIFLKDSLKNETKLWFAGSSADDISIYTNELAKALNEIPLNNLLWKYSDEPNEKHNTIFRATKEKALTWVLKD